MHHTPKLSPWHGGPFVMRRLERPGGGRWPGVLVSRRRRTLWQGTRTMEGKKVAVNDGFEYPADHGDRRDPPHVRAGSRYTYAEAEPPWPGPAIGIRRPLRLRLGAHGERDRCRAGTQAARRRGHVFAFPLPIPYGCLALLPMLAWPLPTGARAGWRRGTHHRPACGPGARVPCPPAHRAHGNANVDAVRVPAPSVRACVSGERKGAGKRPDGRVGRVLHQVPVSPPGRRGRDGDPTCRGRGAVAVGPASLAGQHSAVALPTPLRCQRQDHRITRVRWQLCGARRQAGYADMVVVTGPPSGFGRSCAGRGWMDHEAVHCYY
ncbi:LOW QUALITY PROTEIN: hypothetical protein SETIT_2G303100v2 [Setaria italica]|uniref:Uncharacterized protein n=1 Tax=Setaria italica TaxID=4555 RepID=A0A368Q5A6_SETIT|nr:LOW QUALITY PROTEIN: hypothetical protein SETIT_2G303100v2 [Setaria italica]